MLDLLPKSSKIIVAGKECYVNQIKNKSGEYCRERLAFGISYQHPLALPLFLEVSMRPNVKDLTGQVFGRQKVLNYSGSDKANHALWLVQCLCGDLRIVRGNHLRSAKVLSCKHCSNVKHGFSKDNSASSLYQIWRSMKARCYNKKHTGYISYGARGITVFKPWHNFVAFKKYIEDNLGKRKSGLTIDRIDNSKGYFPKNLQWSSRKEQAQNRRLPKRKI